MTAADNSYDLILVGTGFASSFFLYEYLRHASLSTRVLVLEKGELIPHHEQLQDRNEEESAESSEFVNATPTKPWVFRSQYGGGSNCWWACCPRFLPSDFQLRSRFGVGRDWPFDYSALEQYYQEVEELMAMSGPPSVEVYNKHYPYPQPPHRLCSVGRELERLFPGQLFPQPTARARRAARGRPGCCNSGVCTLCPVDAKFTIQNGFAELYQDPRVRLLTTAPVERLEAEGGSVSEVVYSYNARRQVARGEVIGLGANALFNAELLLRSNLGGGKVGQGLCEQKGVFVLVNLKGLASFDGSTSIPGVGYMFYDGEHRRNHAACLVEVHNIAHSYLRMPPERWNERLVLKFIFEDIPQAENRISLRDTGAQAAVASFRDYSEYTHRGVRMVPKYVEKLTAGLPIEGEPRFFHGKTESHILGTTPMGANPKDSVINSDLLLHGHNNVFVLGGGSFPSISPANPTLTLSALSLRAARRMWKSV